MARLVEAPEEQVEEELAGEVDEESEEDAEEELEQDAEEELDGEIENEVEHEEQVQHLGDESESDDDDPSASEDSSDEDDDDDDYCHRPGDEIKRYMATLHKRQQQEMNYRFIAIFIGFIVFACFFSEVSTGVRSFVFEGKGMMADFVDILHVGIVQALEKTPSPTKR